MEFETFFKNVRESEFVVVFTRPQYPVGKNILDFHDTSFILFDEAVDFAEPLGSDEKWACVFQKVRDQKHLARICDGQIRSHVRLTEKEKAILKLS